MVLWVLGYWINSPIIKKIMILLLRDGNGTEWVQRIGSLPLIAQDFVSSYPRLALHNGEISLASSPPLGALRSPTPPCKTLLILLICHTTSTIFLMKPISLIKIYLKLQLNLSHQIKSIFRNNWIIYSRV